MKKLFISCPMRGLSDEVIKKVREKMHKLAEIYFDQELEVINSHIPPAYDLPESTNRRIWCLGRSIQMMADADYFIGIGYGFRHLYPGCDMEDNVAYAYNISSIRVDLNDLHIPELDEAIKVARDSMYSKSVESTTALL